MEEAGEAADRRPLSFLFAGAAVALASVPLAGTAGAPYLSLSELSPWIVTFSIGLFTALFAAPFAIHRRLGSLLEDDARWERALLWWGAASIVVLAIGLLLGLPGDFASDSLAGSLGLVCVVEAGLVLATLITWLLSN
jgi:hypothetical protein